MKKSLFILLAIFLTYSACDTDDMPIMEDYSELYGSLQKDFELWETYSDDEKTAYLSESYYLGYIPADLALLGFLTDNKAYFEYVKDIISLYKNKFVVNGMLRPVSQAGGALWYRDQFARDNKNLYEAYVYTGYSEILQLVEQQVALWLEKVPRAEHNGYVVFPYGIEEDGSINMYETNPNQTLQVASLFSQLYWEPNSKYYKDELFKDIVYNEVNSVIALQKENGSLPIREGLPLVEDSNYGGYSGDMLYHLAQMWGEQEWVKSTIEIGKWLRRDFSEDHPWNMPEDSPNFASDRNWNSFNLIGRILPFYAVGISKAEISNWIDYIKKSFPEDELDIETRWYFYQSIPRSYLTGKPIPQKLKPFIFNDGYSNQNINIRLVGETIDFIELFIMNEHGKNVFHEEFDNNKSFKIEIPMSEGKYTYKIVVGGNMNTIGNSEDSFYVIAQDNVIFNIIFFDSRNTFLEKVS